MEARESAADAPRFAVVIPAYNAARTIGKALDSVLAQQWPAQEIIVVDDGSSDDTAEVVGRFGSRVSYLRQANAGPSVARNRGVAAASSEWIAFLDADDWYLPQRLRVHAECIREHPVLDFLVASFDYVKPDGEVIGQSIAGTALGAALLERAGPAGIAIIDNEDIGRFISDQFSDTRCLSLPRTTFMALGGFPEDLRICEDVAFMLRLCARSRRAAVACQSLATYSVHDQGLIRSNRERAQRETVRALRTLAAEMAGAPVPVREAWKTLLKNALRNLAVYNFRQGERGRAISSAVQACGIRPGFADLRFLLSVLR